MKITMNDLETLIKALFTMIENHLVICKDWQRPFAWTTDQLLPIMKEIIDTASYPEEERCNHRPYLGNIVVFNDAATNTEVISDGQNRVITLGLIYKALHTICCERGYNIKINDVLNHHHELKEARDEYAKFVDNPSGATKYGKVYRKAYEMLDAYIATEDDALAVKDTCENYCVGNIITCSTEALAHEYFMNLNASGVPLSKTDIISSFLKFYSKKYKVNMSYNYDELVNIVEAYYYVTVPGEVPDSLSPAAINMFMTKYVTKDRDSFVKFNEFVKKTNKFAQTYWYRILNDLDNKSLPVGYTLVGCDYILDGSNSSVNELLTNMVVSNIVGFVSHMTGSATTSHFTTLKSMIGRRTPAEDITAFIKSWAAERYSIKFEEFAIGLDALKDAQKSIVRLAFYAHNKNAREADVEVEEAFPRKAGVAWKKNGWPCTTAGKNELLNSLGNKLLLDATTNKDLGHAGPADKAVGYEEFYQNNAAYRYDENLFDMNTFVTERKEYLDKRRDAYARFLANTSVGSLTIN